MTRSSSEPRPHGWLVLQVAFGDEVLARRAWSSLEPELDIDTIAHEVHGVFPQLASGLRGLGVEPPVLVRLDGVRKRLWTRNTLRTREVLSARNSLDAHGIPAEPTGGLATLLRQPDLSARPLVDAELVISEAHATRAAQLLLDNGWTGVGARRDGWLMDLHAATFVRSGHQVTLRWSDGAWPYASHEKEWPNPSGDRYLRLPSSASLLAYTLVEGHRLWGYTPTRRYADLLLLLRDSEAVAWGDVVRLVHLRGGAAAAARALRSLVGHFPEAVPPDVLDELSDTSRRSEWAVDLGDRSGTVAALVRRMDTTSPLRAIAGAPAFLGDAWGVEGKRGLALAGARRLRARRPGGAAGAGTGTG
jgi:hypothetical protein